VVDNSSFARFELAKRRRNTVSADQANLNCRNQREYRDRHSYRGQVQPKEQRDQERDPGQDGDSNDSASGEARLWRSFFGYQQRQECSAGYGE
jgi:hypothetical protein